MLATRGLGRWFLALTVAAASAMGPTAATASDAVGLLGQFTDTAQARVDRFYRTVFAIHSYVDGHYWYGQETMNYPLVENPFFAWNLRHADRQDLGLMRRELAAARLDGAEHQARVGRLEAAVGALQNLMAWDLRRDRDVGWSGLVKARDRLLEAAEACLVLRSPTGAVNWSTEETAASPPVDHVLSYGTDRRIRAKERLEFDLAHANPVERVVLQRRFAELQRQLVLDVPDGVHRSSADPRLRAPQPRSLHQQLRDR